MWNWSSVGRAERDIVPVASRWAWLYDVAGRRTRRGQGIDGGGMRGNSGGLVFSYSGFEAVGWNVGVIDQGSESKFGTRLLCVRWHLILDFRLPSI